MNYTVRTTNHRGEALIIDDTLACKVHIAGSWILLPHYIYKELKTQYRMTTSARQDIYDEPTLWRNVVRNAVSYYSTYKTAQDDFYSFVFGIKRRHSDCWGVIEEEDEHP